MWQYAPKDKVNSANKINLALHLAVLFVNERHGFSISAICKSIGIQFSQNMLDQLNEIDSMILYETHRQSNEICKQHRKYVKHKKVISMTPSLMMRKVYRINLENSMKVEINTTPKT